MTEGVPKLIPINHDDYHAKYIGKTSDGRQFFLTDPFVPAIGDSVRREFLALYLFDAKGALLEARIEDLGARPVSILPGQVNPKQSQALLEEWLSKLDKVTFCDIKVAPFRVERFGIEFGLMPCPPDEEIEEDHWWVILLPGNYMAFYPPWDGDYDT